MLDEETPLEGSVVRQYVRCGKKNCHCVQGERHGPYYVWIWWEGGKRRRRYLKAHEVASFQAACQSHRAQRRMLRDYKLQLAEFRRARRLARGLIAAMRAQP